MAYIIKGFVKMYYYLNDEIADPTTANWPLMRSPWPGLFLLSLYLMAVLVWLPNHMNRRPPYDLRRLIAAYNIIQILSCGYIVYHSLTLAWLNHYSLVCQPLDKDPNSVEFAWKVCYAYFIIKVIDLVDTVFFVLRKKQNQVSFLHVYHHFGMVAVAWGIVKWVPGGHITMIILINSIVHIIMYAYYLLTTIDESYKRSLWWKKYVTQIQICGRYEVMRLHSAMVVYLNMYIDSYMPEESLRTRKPLIKDLRGIFYINLMQFTIFMFHFLVLILAKDCNYPREPAYILIPQNLFMVILFSDFYYRAYIKSKKN